MWKSDLRLSGLNELVNKAALAKYESSVKDHPYKGLPTIIRWVTAQLSGPASTPDRTIIAADLREGDLHYADLFLQLDLLPKDRDPQLPIEPLTYGVDKIMEAITGKRHRSEENAVIYGYLEEALLTGIAELLAADARYGGYAKWQALLDLFPQSRTFYSALICAIPVKVIREHAVGLAAPYDPSNVVRYISQADKRMEADAYQRHYLGRIEKYRDAAPAVLVDKLTENADTMSLADTEVLKKDLITRLGREQEVTWIDGLRWPLAQAAALNEYQDLKEIAALIAQLVFQRERLKSPFVHLLLIMLDQYVDLMRRISFNLRSFATPPGHHYYEPTIALTAHTEGQARLEAWEKHDMNEAITQLMGPILAISDPTNDLHRGLFGWVANQDRERWLNNPNGRLILQMIDHLHHQYIAAYGQGKWTKGDLLQSIAPDRIDWKRFKLLYTLWLTDEGDDVLRQELRDQMTTYIRSNEFTWNSAYHFDNDHIAQALNLTNLYFSASDAALQLATLTAPTRNWHEGWAYNGAAGIKDANRYIFLLTCGMCLAYLNYDSGNTIAAIEIWQAYYKETTDQYRATGSELDRKHYLLPLRLLIHTLMKFDELMLSPCLDDLFEKIDHMEDRIVIAHTLMETAGLLKKTLGGPVRQKLWHVIQQQYWVLGLRLQHAKHPEEIRHFENLYQAAMPWFLAP